MEAKALYVRDGDAFIGTMLTQGGWDPAVANGGTVLALLGQCLEDVPTLVPMTLSRFTADLHRPVPIGQRLRVVPTIVREGKKLQVVQLQLMVDEVEHVRVSALRLREERVDAGDLASTTDARPADALRPPELARSIRDLTRAGDLPGFLHAVDMRRAATTDSSSIGAWIRLDVPILAGEPTNATGRVVALLDYANLIGMDDHPQVVSLINPDLSAHILRYPAAEEWVAITGETRFDTTLGRGASSATFSDGAGPFAFVTTSQLIQPR